MNGITVFGAGGGAGRAAVHIAPLDEIDAPGHHRTRLGVEEG